MFSDRCVLVTPEAAAAILGVSVFASREEITAAFTLRARLTHPDRFAGAPKTDIAAASSEFVRVSMARDVLFGLLRAGGSAAASGARETASVGSSHAQAQPAPLSRMHRRFVTAAATREPQTWIA